MFEVTELQAGKAVPLITMPAGILKGNNPIVNKLSWFNAFWNTEKTLSFNKHSQDAEEPA